MHSKLGSTVCRINLGVFAGPRVIVAEMLHVKNKFRPKCFGKNNLLLLLIVTLYL